MSGSDDEDHHPDESHEHADDKPDEDDAIHALAASAYAAPPASTLRRDLQRDAAGDAPATAAVKASPWYVDYLPYIIAICIALLLIYWFFNRAPAAESVSK